MIEERDETATGHLITTSWSTVDDSVHRVVLRLFRQAPPCYTHTHKTSILSTMR